MKRTVGLYAAKVLFLGFIAVAINTFAADISTDIGSFYMVGTASWYSESSPGIRPTTANMEIFDEDAMTCAIWDIPFDTLVEVTNLDNGKEIVVRVNDRGPAKRFWRRGRIIDLTKAAFQSIEDPEKGLTRVRIRVI